MEVITKVKTHLTDWFNARSARTREALRLMGIMYGAIILTLAVLGFSFAAVSLSTEWFGTEMYGWGVIVVVIIGVLSYAAAWDVIPDNESN